MNPHKIWFEESDERGIERIVERRGKPSFGSVVREAVRKHIADEDRLARKQLTEAGHEEHGYE